MAQAVELLRDGCRLHAHDGCEARGRERLSEQAGCAEEPVRDVALAAAAGCHHLGGRALASVGGRECEAHEERVPLGAVIQVGDPERRRGRTPPVCPEGSAWSAAAVRRGGRSRSPRAARRRPGSRRAGALGLRGSRARRACPHRPSADRRGSARGARAPRRERPATRVHRPCAGPHSSSARASRGRRARARGSRVHRSWMCRAPLAGPGRSPRRECPRRARSSAPSRGRRLRARETRQSAASSCRCRARLRSGSARCLRHASPRMHG